MKKLRYVYWKSDKFWLGFLQDYPDYLTQGTDRRDLEDHLRDIYELVSEGTLPKAPPDGSPARRGVGELVV